MESIQQKISSNCCVTYAWSFISVFSQNRKGKISLPGQNADNSNWAEVTVTLLGRTLPMARDWKLTHTVLNENREFTGLYNLKALGVDGYRGFRWDHQESFPVALCLPQLRFLCVGFTANRLFPCGGPQQLQAYHILCLRIPVESSKKPWHWVSLA